MAEQSNRSNIWFFRIMRGKLALIIADGRTYVDDREIYAADDLRVGLFKSTDGF